MPNEEHKPVHMIDAIGSTDKDPSDTVKLSVNMSRRLESLRRWRIDPALLEFPEGAPEFEGGDQVVEPSGGNLKSNDCIAKLEDDEGRQEAAERDDKSKDKGKIEAEEQEEKSHGEEFGRPKAVAVKKMKIGMKTGNELTLREAEFLVGLSHENVTKLEGFVEDLSKAMIWLVFPWEENGTLKDFLASPDWEPEIPERISLINDVTKGVEYLHSREPPIVHGDLKSINVLVNSKCRAKISDFGSAHRSVAKSYKKGGLNDPPAIKEPQSSPSLEAAHCPSTNTITLTCNHFTLCWAAPELFDYEESSLASDMWALGCVAYEVMTNSIPFQDVKDTMVIIRVVRGDLPSISDDTRMLLIQALCSLVGQCWSIDPCKRPTAEYCRKAIEWMPMIIPNPRHTADSAYSANRSAELRIKVGQMYRNQRDFSNASKYYTEALGIYEDIGDSGGKANALLELAVMHGHDGQDDRATMYFSKVLEILTDMGYRKGRATTLVALGGMHLKRNDYCQAVSSYSEGLQIFTDIRGVQDEKNDAKARPKRT